MNRNKGILYCLVAVYIGYMGYSILSSRLKGDATLSYPLAILFTSVLVMGAVWIFWYGVRLQRSISGEDPQKEETKETNEIIKANEINETNEICETNEINESNDLYETMKSTKQM